MPHKRDVGVSFHRKPCIRRMALQTMHHETGAGRCVIYLFYFLALPFYYPFIFSECLFYSNNPILQAKVYTPPGLYPWGCIRYFRYPTVAAGYCLHAPTFLPFLLLWQFRVRDGRMHLFQLESNDQQLSFR